MNDIDSVLKHLAEHYKSKHPQNAEEDLLSERLSIAEYYVYWGILRTLPDEDLSRVEEIVDTNGYGSILSHVARKAREAKQPEYKKNETIETLLARYIDKKSRRVVESRTEIIKRFDYLSFTEQKRIVKAFLNSNSVSDMEWAAREADERWDRSYCDLLKSAFEKTNSDTLALTIIHHMPVEYLKSHEAQLVMVNRSDYCLRFPDEADSLMRKYDFNIFEMLYVKARIGQKFDISDIQLERRFFRFILSFAQKALLGIDYCSDTIGNIPWIRKALQALGVLGYRNILFQFLKMNDYAVEQDRMNGTELYYAQKWIIDNYFPNAVAIEPIDEQKVMDGIKSFVRPHSVKIISKEELDQYDDLPPALIDIITDLL